MPTEKVNANRKQSKKTQDLFKTPEYQLLFELIKFLNAKSLNKEVKNLKYELDNQSIRRVLLSGLPGLGKTSLLEAMTGFSMSTSATGLCTGTIISIEHDQTVKDVIAVIHFKAGNTQTIPNPEKEDIDIYVNNETVAEIKIKGNFKNLPLIIPNIGNKKFALLDSPGNLVLDASHNEITTKIMSKSHLIICVLNYGRVETENNLQIIKSLTTQRNFEQDPNAYIFIFNKIDIDKGEGLEVAKHQLVEMLHRFPIFQQISKEILKERIFGISAIYAKCLLAYPQVKKLSDIKLLLNDSNRSKDEKSFILQYFKQPLERFELDGEADPFSLYRKIAGLTQLGQYISTFINSGTLEVEARKTVLNKGLAAIDKAEQHIEKHIENQNLVIKQKETEIKDLKKTRDRYQGGFSRERQEFIKKLPHKHSINNYKNAVNHLANHISQNTRAVTNHIFRGSCVYTEINCKRPWNRDHYVKLKRERVEKHLIDLQQAATNILNAHAHPVNVCGRDAQALLNKTVANFQKAITPFLGKHALKQFQTALPAFNTHNPISTDATPLVYNIMTQSPNFWNASGWKIWVQEHDGHMHGAHRKGLVSYINKCAQVLNNKPTQYIHNLSATLATIEHNLFTKHIEEIIKPLYKELDDAKKMRAKHIEVATSELEQLNVWKAKLQEQYNQLVNATTPNTAQTVDSVPV